MRKGRRKRRSDDIAAVRPAGGENRKSAGLKNSWCDTIVPVCYYEETEAESLSDCQKCDL